MKRSSRFTLLSGLFLALALILAACAAPAAVTGLAPDASPQPAETSTAAPAGCLGAAQDAVADLNCREVTIAVENMYLPFNYVSLASGQPGGWDYDAWREICTRLHCAPVFVEVGWDSLIPSVASGQYNVGADGITITDERAKEVDFSSGYLQIQQRLLVRKGETRFTTLQEIADSDKLLLATQSSTTNYETAVETVPAEKIKAFEQMPFAVQALISGDVDAVLIDEVVGMGYLGENGDKLEFVGEPVTSEELGFAYPKGSDLREPVDQALAAMRQDGTLAKLDQKYFSPDFKITENDIVTGN